MYKVSVVIPVFNAGEYIECCARSLFEQTLDSIEYIFVNDCSTDNSMDVLHKVLGEYPQRKEHVIVVNHTTNTGQSGARKDGMNIASGEYIIHCDADDWVDLEMYECMYNKAVTDNVEAVCCDIVLERKNSSKVLRYNTRYEDHELMYRCVVPISVEYFSMCNRLVSRNVFERYTIQPFEGVNMWDDVGLSVRVRYYVNSTSVINKAFYHYNRKNSISTTKRPLLDRVREQSLCINCIEDFFKKEHSWDKYRYFISNLKVLAKRELFFYDADLWINIFKESREDLWKLRKSYSVIKLFRYYVLSYGGNFGKLIWKICWKR